jgi:hypothetical protein
MDNKPEVTRADLDETRASLSEKLETLEQQVVQSVHGATHAVNETVESVKEAVHDTVATVKDTFDLSLQVRRRPWSMVGGAIALGYLGSCLLRRRDADRPSPIRGSQLPIQGNPQKKQYEELPKNGQSFVDEASGTRPVQKDSPRSSEHGWLTERFGPEITKLKGLAIGTALSVVRDLITQTGPEQIRAELAEMMDSITVKLGGEPIRGPVLKENLRAQRQDMESNDSEYRRNRSRNSAATSGNCGDNCLTR